MVDGFSQLCMGLRLYNALKVMGLPREDNQGFLEFLDKHFQNSKVV